VSASVVRARRHDFRIGAARAFRPVESQLAGRRETPKRLILPCRIAIFLSIMVDVVLGVVCFLR
jgi:hypothetical protein